MMPAPLTTPEYVRIADDVPVDPPAGRDCTNPPASPTVTLLLSVVSNPRTLMPPPFRVAINVADNAEGVDRAILPLFTVSVPLRPLVLVSTVSAAPPPMVSP